MTLLKYVISKTFQGHMKLVFIATPGLGGKSWKVLLFRSLSDGGGETFSWGFCMPVHGLLLWEKEDGKAAWGNALEDKVFSSTRKRKCMAKFCLLVDYIACRV